MSIFFMKIELKDGLGDHQWTHEWTIKSNVMDILTNGVRMALYLCGSPLASKWFMAFSEVRRFMRRLHPARLIGA